MDDYMEGNWEQITMVRLLFLHWAKFVQWFSSYAQSHVYHHRPTFLLGIGEKGGFIVIPKAKYMT